MPLRNCLDLIIGKNSIPQEDKDFMLKQSDEYKKQGISDDESDRKALTDYHKKLHDDLNKLKKSIGVKQSAYSPIDKNVAEINKNYDAQKEELKNNLLTQNQTENAIREQSASSVLQHPQSAVGETGSERGRMEPSEQGNETIGTRIEQPKEESKNKGEEKNVSGEQPMTGIKHESTEEKRKEFGLGEYERNNATDAELESQANEAIKKDYNIEGLIKKVEDKIPPTGVENFILKKYLAGLEADFRKTKSEKTLEQAQRVYDALDKIGSLQSEAFRTRKGLEPTDDTMLGFFSNEKTANNEAPLTENQKKVATEDFNKFQEAKVQFEKDKQALEEDVAKFRAEQEAAKTKKATPKITQKTHSDFVKERKDSIEKAREALRKLRTGESGLGAVPLPGIRELIAIAPHVKDVLKSYLEEGALKLSDAIEKLHDDFKEFGVSKTDIHNIIAGEYNEKKITKKEAAIRMEDLRIEAQLINKLEKLQNGEEPKNEKAKIKRNQEIEKLRKQIKEFKKEEQEQINAAKEAEKELERQNKATAKESAKKSPQEIALNAIKKRNESEIQKIHEKIKKGDFAPEEKKTPLLEDKELAKIFPERYKAAKKSRDALIKAKKDIELRRLKQMYEKKTPQEKFAIGLTKALNVPRTLMASMDLSAPFRQGFVATVSHPFFSSKAAKFMLQAAKDHKVYDAWLDNVHNDPLWNTAEKSKLAVTDPETLHLKDKEEAFLGGNYAEAIPGVAASERAYVGFLNKLRWDLFKFYSNVFESQGKTYDNNPELYKGLASFINSSTGRGGMAFGESASPFLSSVIFSPRLIASRLNMLGLSDIPNLLVRGATLGKYGVDYGFYSKLPKEIRILAAKDMLKTVAVGLTTLALAKAASNVFGGNIQVEDDPRSADFGKIRSGDTRWDIWGGFLPYARVLTQFISGQRKTDKAGVYDIESKFGQSRADVLGTFGRSKLAPIPGALWDIASRKTVTGDKVNRTFGNPFNNPPNEINLTNEVAQHLMPLIIQDVADAWKTQGVKSLFTVGVPSAIGMGVQTYQPRQSTAPKESSKFYKKEDSHYKKFYSK